MYTVFDIKMRANGWIIKRGANVMKIGCNWSEELFNLIQDKCVNIDYIKSFQSVLFDIDFERMRSLKPILLHGLGYEANIGMKNIRVVDFQQANELIKKCGSPHYGFHSFIPKNDISIGMTNEDIHIYISERIQFLKKNLLVPLLIENMPDIHSEEDAFYPYFEAEKIGRLVIDNDINLLLDLTHAKLTSISNNWNVHDFLKDLPLERVKEIHVNGSGYDNQGFPDDTHQSMSDADYELLDWILTYSNPDIITLEYKGVAYESSDLISENLYYQLKMLNSML